MCGSCEECFEAEGELTGCCLPLGDDMVVVSVEKLR